MSAKNWKTDPSQVRTPQVNDLLQVVLGTGSDRRTSLSHSLGLVTSYTVGFSGVQPGGTCLWLEHPSLVQAVISRV